MKRIKLISLLMIVLLAVATGCGTAAKREMERYSFPAPTSDYGHIKNKQAEPSPVRALNADQTPKEHQEGSVFYSYTLSDAVNEIDGVADARVFVADEIAYVAVVLDNTGRGMLKSMPSGQRDSSVFNEKVTAPMSIHNNPFISYLTVNDTSQLSDLFVGRVHETVMAHDGSIHSVHLSANKEFMYYMDEFAQVVWGGASLDPYMKQFNILINHQFFNGQVMPTSLKYYRNR